jgi:hypothetical protein
MDLSPSSDGKGSVGRILIGFLVKAGILLFFPVTHWLRVSDR